MSAQQRYGEILVATDGSDAADVAVDHAITAAKAHDATMHALYIVDTRITMAADDETRGVLSDQLTEQGQAAVEEIVEDAIAADVEASGTIGRGTPWKEILSYATTSDIDLIVIGTTGKSPREKRMGMGSVSERVVDGSSIPVLVVPNF